MALASDLLTRYSSNYETRRDTEMSIAEFLEGCKSDPNFYASAAERLLHAIGEPLRVNTAQDSRLGRIFMNRTIRIYPAFKEFYGMEDTVERIVSYFRHAAQGLEERKQILYLLGPVGGGKSSLAERLKQLMEQQPIYALKANGQVSPVFESPLCLFDPVAMGEELETRFNIPRRKLTGLMSPWCLKRLDEAGGDLSKFSVVKLTPSRLRQIAIAKTEPGDENNQDISSLVGKVDIRKLEHLPQHDPDAYSYSGGLNRANQGLLEFVEMFKAPIKMLHPLLTATQEGNYIGTENIGAIPFTGVILAHSNEAEWNSFKTNKNNEAFIDRIYLIKVPYCLRVSEEQKIYEKLIHGSELARAPCAPRASWATPACGASTLRRFAPFSKPWRRLRPRSSAPAKLCWPPTPRSGRPSATAASCMTVPVTVFSGNCLNVPTARVRICPPTSKPGWEPTHEAFAAPDRVRPRGDAGCGPGRAGPQAPAQAPTQSARWRGP